MSVPTQGSQEKAPAGLVPLYLALRSVNEGIEKSKHVDVNYHERLDELMSLALQSIAQSRRDGKGERPSFSLVPNGYSIGCGSCQADVLARLLCFIQVQKEFGFDAKAISNVVESAPVRARQTQLKGRIGKRVKLAECELIRIQYHYKMTRDSKNIQRAIERITKLRSTSPIVNHERAMTLAALHFSYGVERAAIANVRMSADLYVGAMSTADTTQARALAAQGAAEALLQSHRLEPDLQKLLTAERLLQRNERNADAGVEVYLKLTCSRVHEAKFAYTRNHVDMQAGLRLVEEVFASLTPEHSMYLSAAGELVQMSILGRPVDPRLDVESRAAIRGLPDGHRFAFLGWFARARQAAAVEDFDNAEVAMKRAILASPEGTPLRARLCLQLCQIKRQQFQCLGTDSVIAEALEIAQQIVQSSSDTGTLIDAHRELADVHALTKSYERELEQLEATISLMALDGAAAGGATSNELVRSRLGNELVGARALAAALSAASEESHAGHKEQLLLRGLDALNSFQSEPRRREERARIIHKLDGMGEVDNYRDALASGSAVRIAEASRDLRAIASDFDVTVGPSAEEVLRLGLEIAIVNLSPARCDAVLITQGRLRTIPLVADLWRTIPRAANWLYAHVHPDSMEDQVGGDWSQHSMDVADVADVLWEQICKPVLHALEEDDGSEGRLIPITWMLTGVLQAFPIILAQGMSGNLEDSILSHAVSTITYSFEALNSQRTTHLEIAPCSPRDLARCAFFAVPRVDGYEPLAGVRREQESLSGVLGDALVKFHPRSSENPPTPAAALEALKRFRWVHFACHGTSDLRNPLSSELLLLDGRKLRISDVRDTSSCSAGLVYLSACLSAAPSFNLVSASMSMASAFLAVGVPSVIGSAWPVNDKATSRLASFFAVSFVQTGSDSALALHEATLRLREEDPSKFEIWAAFSHFGNPTYFSQ